MGSYFPGAPSKAQTQTTEPVHEGSRGLVLILIHVPELSNGWVSTEVRGNKIFLLAVLNLSDPHSVDKERSCTPEKNH